MIYKNKSIAGPSFVLEVIRRMGILVALLVIALAVFGFINPRFLSTINIVSVLRQTTFLAILAMGSMFPLVVGGFDLSIGAIISLISVISTLIMKMEIFPSPILMVALGIIAGILVATMVGLFNGLIIAVFRVSPFIVTLATMSISAGSALIIAKGVPIFGIPDIFSITFAGDIVGIPVPIVATILIAIVGYLVMNWTHLGRFFWAIGGNINAAKLSGIFTEKYVILAYAISGFLAGISGMLLTARVGSGELTLGSTLMMKAIAAAVLGGTAVGGGKGDIPGVVLGAFFITLLANGMNLVGLGSFIQQVILGILLLFAIIVDRYTQQA